MQHRKAHCRACGGVGTYPTGWSLMTNADLEALENALGTAIKSQAAWGEGQSWVRLRLRFLRCVHCRERGLLVAGTARPITARDVIAH